MRKPSQSITSCSQTQPRCSRASNFDLVTVWYLLLQATAARDLMAEPFFMVILRTVGEQPVPVRAWTVRTRTDRWTLRCTHCTAAGLSRGWNLTEKGRKLLEDLSDPRRGARAPGAPRPVSSRCQAAHQAPPPLRRGYASPVGTSRRALGMSALTVQRKQRGGLGMLGRSLDVIDAPIASPGPAHATKGAVGLLSDDRDPAIVVVRLSRIPSRRRIIGSGLGDCNH